MTKMREKEREKIIGLLSTFFSRFLYTCSPLTNVFTTFPLWSKEKSVGTSVTETKREIPTENIMTPAISQKNVEGIPSRNIPGKNTARVVAVAPSIAVKTNFVPSIALFFLSL